MEDKGSGSVLVVGGGIGGIQASLDLADSGYKVFMVEKSPTIGGKMAQLDKTFPTNDCSMCIMSPKLVDCARHLNIDLFTYAEVESVKKENGKFNVSIRQKAGFVDEDKCTGCTDCEEVCPVSRSNEFDLDLASRKAIYRPFPQASPNIFTIEKKGMSPCTDACPAGCNAHGYVALIREGKFREALELIRERIPLPGICGRVCGYCEDACNRANVDEAIQIRALKRFASDYELSHPVEEKEEKKGKKKNGKKVAVIGSGPAGLTAAYDLALKGYEPVVFESYEKTGGMLRVGIPDYRLPEDILDHEIQVICDAGVIIETGKALGRDFSLEDLKKEGYKAVFLSMGTHQSRSLNIEGESLNGVVGGLEFLRNIAAGEKTLDVKGKTVAVIGGGNTAIDAVRSALRLGAKKAFILYRRSREQMPVSAEELEAAEAEGIEINYLLSPSCFAGKNGKIDSVTCQKMRLDYPDSSGRRRPVAIEGATEKFKADAVLMAIGQAVDFSHMNGSLKNLELQRDLVKVDPVTLETSLPGIFAGGDAAGAEGYVVHAIAHGHAASESIDRYIRRKDLKNDRNGKPLHIARTPKEPRKNTPEFILK